MVMPDRPRTSDRMVIVGRTGTGKSTLARALLESFPPPRLVIDPKAAETTAYAVTFHDPGRIPDAPAARFIPRDPDDLDAYDRLYRAIFVAGPRAVWLDEAPIAAPSNAAPRGLLTVIRQGRGRGIGHIATGQRPVHIARELITESEHVIAFPTQHPADLDTLAGVMAYNPRQLRADLASLPTFGFAWYAARNATLALCPPISPIRR